MPLKLRLLASVAGLLVLALLLGGAVLLWLAEAGRGTAMKSAATFRGARKAICAPHWLAMSSIP